MNFRPRPGEALRVQKPEKSKRFGPTVSLPPNEALPPLANRSDSVRAIHTPNEALPPAKALAFSTKRFASRETQCSRTKRSPFFHLGPLAGSDLSLSKRSASTGLERFPQSEALHSRTPEKTKRFAAKTQKGERFANSAAGRAWSRRAGLKLMGLSATKRFVKTKEPAGDLNRFVLDKWISGPDPGERFGFKSQKNRSASGGAAPAMEETFPCKDLAFFHAVTGPAALK